MEESSISSYGPVHGYGNHMEDYQMGEHFWNFFTKEESKATYYNNGEADVEVGMDAHIHDDFKDITACEVVEIEDCIDNDFCRNNFVVDGETDDDGIEDYTDTRFHVDDFQDMTVEYSHVEVPDKITYSSYSYDKGSPAHSNDSLEKFIKATRKGDWDDMEEIGGAHPEILTMKIFHRQGTALHHTLWYGDDRVDTAKCLVKLMEPQGLEIQDRGGYTPLGLAVLLHHDNSLLDCIIEKNPDSPNIGKSESIPIVVASFKGFRDTTKFLYPFTDDKILHPDYKNLDDSNPDPVLGLVGIILLNQCINIKLFDIAENLLEKFPEFLRRRDDLYIYPTHALAKAVVALQTLSIEQKQSSERNNMLSNFGDCIMNWCCYILLGDYESSSDDQESIHIREAYELLRFIIRVEDFDIDIENTVFIVDAMMEAAKHGIIEFITEILKVDRELIGIHKDDKNMFWHAIMNRQEKVFNLIYAFDQKKDMLLSFQLEDEEVKDGKKKVKDEDNTRKSNILHFTARLPPSLEHDRVSDRALQMQRELQWFQAVQDITIPRYREDLNKSGLTPYALFTETHKELVEDGEKSMKKTAGSASTVGGLILTTMFAASIAVISGTDQIQGSDNPSYDAKVFFIVFIIFAAVSLCSCTASILVFLGILASRYCQEDFLSSLPGKFMTGFWLLFGAIMTMMLAFCCALFIMLKGPKLHFIIIPIFLLSLLPVAAFFRYIFPVLRKIYVSTKNPIFDKNTKLPKAEKGNGYCR